jgi:hypothetical protein
MFLRPATPSAAGRPPGLLRRAFSAVRAAVAAVRPKTTRIGGPQHPGPGPRGRTAG